MIENGIVVVSGKNAELLLIWLQAQSVFVQAVQILCYVASRVWEIAYPQVDALLDGRVLTQLDIYSGPVERSWLTCLGPMLLFT